MAGSPGCQFATSEMKGFEKEVLVSPARRGGEVRTKKRGIGSKEVIGCWIWVLKSPLKLETWSLSRCHTQSYDFPWQRWTFFGAIGRKGISSWLKQGRKWGKQYWSENCGETDQVEKILDREGVELEEEIGGMLESMRSSERTGRIEGYGCWRGR